MVYVTIFLYLKDQHWKCYISMFCKQNSRNCDTGNTIGKQNFKLRVKFSLRSVALGVLAELFPSTTAPDERAAPTRLQ